MEFSLYEDDFRENEAPNAMMGIEIAKDGILANPVLFRITPLTVTDAERLNILNFTRPAYDKVSPSVAGKVEHKWYVHITFGSLFLHRYK